MTVGNAPTLPLVIEGHGEPAVQRLRAEREGLRAALRERGALLLRGFDAGGADGFADIVRALSGEPLPYTERSSPRSVIKGNVYTSTEYPPGEEIFLHNENSYQASWPLTLYFHCVRPPLTRGATPLADTRRVLAAVDDEVRREFARRGWAVVRNYGDLVGLPWQEAFATVDRAEVERYCRERGIEAMWLPGGGLRTRAVREAVHRHPATGEPVWFNHVTVFHVTTLPESVRLGLLEMLGEENLPSQTYYGDGEPIPDDVMDHLRACYRAASTRFDYRADDVLVIDNMLVSHGREPFTGPRRIAVAMAEPYPPTASPRTEYPHMVARSLRSNRDFSVFWAVQALSEVGNAFSLVALPLLVLHTTGSAAQMGLLTAVAGATSLLTGLVGGSWADRFDRLRLLMLCDAARLVLYGAIPVCWALSPQIWLLYVVMALASVFEMLFKITYVTAVANLVDKEQIVAANGRLEATNAIAYIAGPALAGVVAGFFGPTAAVAINAGSFGVSLVGLVFVRLRPTARPVADRSESETGSKAGRARNGLAGFRTGAAFLWHTPVLRALTVLLTVTTFLSLGMTDVFIYHLRHGLGQDERTVGYVLALAGLGTCVAAAATARLRRSWGFGRCWLGAFSLCSVSVLVLGGTGRVSVAAVTICLYSFGMALAGVCSMSLRQQVTPDHLLGRVTSAFWTIHGSLAPLGAALLTALVGRLGARGPLTAVAAVFLAVVVAAAFTPIRQRHPERTAVQPPRARPADAPSPREESHGDDTETRR